MDQRVRPEQAAQHPASAEAVSPVWPGNLSNLVMRKAAGLFRGYAAPYSLSKLKLWQSLVGEGKLPVRKPDSELRMRSA
jgi:hypothetical protein